MKKNNFRFFIVGFFCLWCNFSFGNLDLDAYGTHMVPLLTAVANTSGPVLEMGCGHFSTPLLHALCSVAERYLVTAETDKNWLSLFLYLERPWHSLKYVPVYEDDLNKNPKPSLWDTIGNDVEWSVVFIDHRPGERRKEDIVRLRHCTQIFVVHDSQQPAYMYEEVLKTFKFRYDYTVYPTYTTLVSNVIDVAKLFK